MSDSHRAYVWPNKRATPITPEHFELGPNGAGDKLQALEQLFRHASFHKAHFAGYQSNTRFKPSPVLSQLLNMAVNNIGDAYANPGQSEPGHSEYLLADGYFSLNAKWIEREVIDYFAARWGFGDGSGRPARRKVKEDCAPGDDSWEDSHWGYVLSMGSTEGNLMALRSARDYLKGRQLQFEKVNPDDDDAVAMLHYEECREPDRPELNPKLLYSGESHYSVRKLAQMLELEAEVVKPNPHGQMDIDALIAAARRIVLVEKRPIAVMFNYGTTWSGALDDVEAAVPRLIEVLKEGGMYERTVFHDGKPCKRQGFWFHVDGALGAGYATFATPRRQGDPERLPGFGFKEGVQSISMSGHKWPGAPWPTGIFMTRNRFMLTNDVPSYVGSLDSTLAGSRSGIAPIFLWDWLASQPDSTRRDEADAQLALSRRVLTWIKDGFDDVPPWDPAARRAPGSIMVICKRPHTEVVHKYALAGKTEVELDEEGRPVSHPRVHIICMPGVDEALIKALIREMHRAAEEDSEGLATQGSSSLDLEGAARGGF